jgi:hypothetical protein
MTLYFLNKYEIEVFSFDDELPPAASYSLMNTLRNNSHVVFTRSVYCVCIKFGRITIFQ